MDCPEFKESIKFQLVLPELVDDGKKWVNGRFRYYPRENVTHSYSFVSRFNPHYLLNPNLHYSFSVVLTQVFPGAIARISYLNTMIFDVVCNQFDKMDCLDRVYYY